MASGLNLYQVDLLDLAAISFVLLDEEWHPRLLRGIGVELDRRGDHEHRRDQERAQRQAGDGVV